MVRKGIITWNVAVTSGVIGTRRHAVYAIAVMVPELFAERNALNVGGQESSRERLGTSKIRQDRDGYS